jgi:transposase
MNRTQANALPDDPAALKAIVATLTRERDQAARQRDEAARQLAESSRRLAEAARQHDELTVQKLRLEVELLRLKKLYYGPRADRLNSAGEIAQMLLDFAAGLEATPVTGDARPPPPPPPQQQAAPASADADPKSARRVRKGRRRNLADFERLPVTRHVHDLSDEQKPCPCCGKARVRIGEESSWQVEYVPGHFERIEHVQVKYACRQCEADAANPQIARADKPAQPIDKGMAGPGLLAYVVTSKYADYLPLYRLQSIFERNGLELDRSTLCVWCGDVADLVTPLYRLMIDRVLASHVVATDDTVMPMLAPGKAKQARMWVYVGDEANPYNIFDFTLGRSRDGPAAFLKDFTQTLLADAYGGYDGVVVGNAITRAGCWAHARRKFVDAEKVHPQIAAEAVGLIRQLYAIEGRASGAAMDAAARLALRQRESAPLLASLKDKLLGWREQLLPKHPMREAVQYALNQWDALNVFAADGSVPIDNNVSEREMKRVVLNRKNSLFVGNERGGRTAAILSSLTSTCRRHAIDPQRYLTQLLTNLPATPISQLDQWLPDVWKRNQAAATIG